MNYYDDTPRSAPLGIQNSLRSFTQTEQLQNEKLALENRLKRVNRALEILSKNTEIEELLNCL